MKTMLSGFRRLLRNAGPGAPPADGKAVDSQPVTEEAVIWALRLLVGRDPVNAEEIALHRRNATLGDLRTAFMRTWEFEALHARATGKAPRFVAPAFLTAPPADPALPWRLAPPSLAQAVSQLCTGEQLEEPAFAEIMRALRIEPRPHRKLWEYAWIVSVLKRQGLLAPGLSAIGFGCGREPIPAFLAAHGVAVLATDAPAEERFNQGWAGTNQYAAQVSDLFVPGIAPRDAFDRLVSFQPLDMNAIPADLAGRYDMCWSACSLEHLGSLRHGLDFIENSLSVLRPGGIAVHTTEFNLTSNDETMESPGLSIYRRRDIEELATRLTARGHRVLPLNLNPGRTKLDRVVDLPPYGLPHLKLKVQGMTLTSIGIAVRRAGGPARPARPPGAAARRPGAAKRAMRQAPGPGN